MLKPDLYEPELNPVYAATLAHYGVVADPARVRDPNRKGSVENAIGHTQATALKGRRFESLEEQNDFLEHWESKWAPRASTAARAARCKPCSRRSGRCCSRCRRWACSSSPSRSAPCAHQVVVAADIVGSGSEQAMLLPMIEAVRDPG